VVCTKYHKGRLKFAYDPVADISASNPGTNEVYTHILDLGESNELTIEIPYHQALAWLTINQSQNDDWNPGGALAPNPNSANGTISVSVFNTLEAPSTPSALYIMCYITAGDDFEFANPQGNVNNGGTSYVPSFFALQGEETSVSITLGEPAKHILTGMDRILVKRFYHCENFCIDHKFRIPGCVPRVLVTLLCCIANPISGCHMYQVTVPRTWELRLIRWLQPPVLQIMLLIPCT